MTLNDLHLYWIVDCYSGYRGLGCWASNSILAGKLGMNPTYVSERISRLRSIGLMPTVGSVTIGRDHFRLLETPTSRLRIDGNKTQNEWEKWAAGLIERKVHTRVRVNIHPSYYKHRIENLDSPPTSYGSYADYLESEWWKWRRVKALRLANFKCNRCASSENLHVHHRTYKNLGAEKDRDLEVLCKDCHERHHGIKP